MELRPGYKRTEVGVIPEEWEVKRLGDLATFVTSGSRDWAKFYSDTGALFIRSQNVRDGKLNLEDSQFVSPPSGVEGNRTKVNEKDLLITITGNSVGNVALVEQKFDEAYISQHVGLVRLNEPTRGGYVCQYLSPNSPGNLQIVKSQSGQSKPGLNLQNLLDFRIALPPMNEEVQAIAEALGNVDRVLDKLHQLITKTRDLKQAVMQQLLTGKTRLPGFTGEWEVKRLGDAVEIKKGKLITERGIVPGSVPVIAGGKLPAYFHDKPNRTGKTVTISASGASAGYVSLYLVPIFASDCSTISEGPDYCIDFIYFLLQSQQERIYRSQTGGAQPHVHPADLSPLEFSMPDRAEQAAIAAVLSDMEAEIATREALRDKTRALKQAMMQELLTGRKRLVKPAAQVIPFPAAKAATSGKSGHNEHFNEAVVIAVLAKHFGSDAYPLGRFRYTKLSYLLHRRAERNTEQYLRKAAGPYNPKTKYGGAEKIALSKGYVRGHQSGNYSGFVAGGNVAEAEGYFREWYGDEILTWLEQFRKASKDDLELFTTVFGAIDGVARAGRAPSFKSVKQFIADEPEWRAKLQRPLFSDDNIVRAGRKYRDLFGDPPVRMPHT